LNRDFLLDSDALGRYPIHMILLAPEKHCYWDRGVSYLFHDLRDL
ncbi:MAG: methylase, partial [Armatimonadetes bacterium CG_4_9_14_3_um_filter_66_14]